MIVLHCACGAASSFYVFSALGPARPCCAACVPARFVVTRPIAR